MARLGRGIPHRPLITPAVQTIAAAGNRRRRLALTAKSNMEYLKQSTAATMSIGPALDSTGAEYTGLVIGDLTLTKNGTSAAMAAAATLTATSNGFYDLVMTTGNTDTLGRLLVRCNKSTYQIPPREFMVLPATVYDAIVTNAAGGANGLLLSLASNQVDVGKWLGTAVNTPTVAGVPNVNAKTWNDLATVALPLIPTTAGRTLDVSAGGEAGVDWANVGSPTTSLALTGTTIASTQKVDLETIKTNPVVNAGTVTFPTTATLASTTNITAGTLTTVTTATNVTTVNGLGAGVITAASIAADAITDAKVASDVTIASVTGAVGSVTGNVGGNVVGSVASVTAAVTVGTINANVVNASALAADAVTEIWAASTALTTAQTAAAVWNALTASYGTAGTYGEALEAVGAGADPWLTNLPGAYGAGTAGYIIGTNLNATVSSRASQTSLDTLDDLVDTEVAAILAVAIKVDTMLVLDGAVYQLTANALELAPTGSGGGSSGTVLQSNPSIQRGTTELTPIYFTFPTASLSDAAFTTQTKRIDGATAANITGTITYLYTSGGLYWYSIAYDASDRPASAAAGVVQYVLSDGTSTVAIDLRVSDIASSGGDVTDEFVKRGLHELG